MSSDEEEYEYSDEDLDYEEDQEYDYDDDMSSDGGGAAAAAFSVVPLKRVSSYRVVKIGEIAKMMQEVSAALGLNCFCSLLCHVRMITCMFASFARTAD